MLVGSVATTTPWTENSCDKTIGLCWGSEEFGRNTTKSSSRWKCLIVASSLISATTLSPSCAVDCCRTKTKEPSPIPDLFIELPTALKIKYEIGREHV